MKRIYYVPIGLAVLAVFAVSFFLIPATPQSITAPSEVYCQSNQMRVKFVQEDIRSGDIDEMLFQHGSSTVRDCPIWAGLRDGQSFPVIQSATFDGNDIKAYISPVQKKDNYGIEWLSGFTVPNSNALVSYLRDTYGIEDNSNFYRDLVVNIVFYDGSCNSDQDCAGEEYCMLAANLCQPISCDDGDICTTDSAANHECSYTAIPNCCHDNDDCALDEVCASNVCTVGCRDIPERPCDLAVFIDSPTCGWDTMQCQESFWSIVMLVGAIIGITAAIGVGVWWLRK